MRKPRSINGLPETLIVGFADLHAASRHPDEVRPPVVNTHVLNGPGATPADAELRQADKYASGVLTVWRFLHLEVDSMVPVTGNYVEGNIMSLDTGDSDTAMAVFVDTNLDDGSPQLDGPTVGAGRFEGGSLTIAGAHDIDTLDGNGSDFLRRAAGLDICDQPLPFEALGPIPLAPIMGSVTGVSNQTTLAVNVTVGSLAADFIGGEFSIGGGPWRAITGIAVANNEVVVDALRVPFRAYDDDSTNGTAISRPDTSRMTVAFEPAYILPREGILPGDQLLPFVANIQDIMIINTGWSYTNDPLRAPRLWVAYVRGAFQSDTKLDTDAKSEGYSWGIADIDLPSGTPSAGGVNIYWEGHNESTSANLQTPNLPGRGFQECDTVVHEVGHLFTCLHNDEGVMGDDNVGEFNSIDFDPRSLDKIRKRITP
jgi:hypothetical protein